MLPRRHVLAAAPLGFLTLMGCKAGKAKAVDPISDFAAGMAKIRQRQGGRIGVSAISAEGKKTVGMSSDERFATCSTFKWLLATAILQGVDQGKLSLKRQIAYTQADLLAYAPVTTKHLEAEGQLSVGDLCAAAVQQSDNTAANLLYPLVGGPAGLTRFIQTLGDSLTRLDRIEPDLNSNIAGDPRDTTTPAAMAGLLKTVFTGTVLKPASLKILTDWMKGATTGAGMIRAGVPEGWAVAEKTGRGANGAANDVAVLWPPKSGPIFLAIYTSESKLGFSENNQVIADVTQLVLATLEA